MAFKKLTPSLALAACAVALCIGAFTYTLAQPAANFFTLADANKDGFVTRDELKSAIAQWLIDGKAGGTGSLTQEQLAVALDAAFPESAFMSMLNPRGPQNQTPKAEDVEKMVAALPAAAPAKPKKPRKVLVLSKCVGYVHSCIPLAAKTVEQLGSKTGAWTTTVTYDSAAITAENLKQYDLLFLNNTTGAFLDDPNDPAATAARKKALLDFVRSGKGLAGIHAAADSYHQATGGFAFGGMLAPNIMAAADKNEDKKLTPDELNALGDAWFDKMDSSKAGRLSVQDFRGRLRGVLFTPPAGRRGAPATPATGRPGRDRQSGTWPEFNKTIGGFFKYHWLDPQHIVYKIDDPNSPLTAMFRGTQFEINDETYTFGMDTWSRANLHILTSIDYSKMSDADKLKEDYPREDHDYGLSWIRREGKGRVFYEAHGHNERVYAVKPMLEHLLAGVQYALGDLKANDAPSAKAKK
jgi:type 1 glutamine amidotransferase